MRSLTLELLGGFDVRGDDGAIVGIPTHKYRALLAFLAMPAGRFHRRDTLVALLWDSLPHEQARAALRQALWTLRRALNTGRRDLLILDGDAVALDAGRVTSDVREFAAAAGRADRESLECAASLYRGVFLAGLSARESPFEDWLTGERERLGQLAIAAFSRLLALQRTQGLLDHAVQTGLRLLTLDPLQEDVHRTVMTLHLELGRRGAALRQYQACVGILQRELGAEPEPDTRALYRELVRQHAAPAQDSDRPASTARRRAPVPSRHAPMLETPLVGRERELAALRAALTDALEGRGRVAMLTGEAGIGKSRLVAELMSEAAAGGASVIVGRAYESAQVLPFGPWAEALRHRDVFDDGILATLLPAFRAHIARFVPELASPNAAGPGAIDDFRAIFDGVLQLVTAAARTTPMVIVLEDLHWADDMTQRLASFVARGLAGRLPVLLILTARDDGHDTDASWRRIHDDLERDGWVTALTLGQLAREDTDRLVRSLVPRHGDETIRGIAEMVFAATEGHPFMIVEMVRGLPAWPDGELPTQLALPQRVRRLIERRFEHLEAPARQALAVAAVIGRDFDYRVFRRACALGEDAAVAGLEELVRRRVLHAAGDGFEFTHDRLREVAHADLIPPRRKLLHRRVAAALEEVYAENLVEHHAAIGAHYAGAEVWDRAARHLHEAARIAQDRLAYREGIVLLERALEALTRTHRTRDAVLLETDIRLRLFRCLNALGDARAGEHVMIAQDLVADAHDHTREATILVELAELRRFGRDLAGAIEAGTRALDVASRLDDRRVRALAHFQLGAAHFTRGAYGEALEHLTATAAAFAQAPLREQLGYPHVPALCRLSWAYTDLGEIDAAQRYAEAATRVAEAGDHAPSIAEASTALGVLCLACGRPADAIAPLERAAGLARQWGIPYLRSFSFSWLALAYARCQRIDEARALLDECESQRVWEHVRLQWSRIVVRLAEARLLIGEPGSAERLAERGLSLATSIGEPAGAREARALKARLAGSGHPTLQVSAG